MCANKNIQRAARAEVDALGRDPETAEDLRKLTFVEACVLETLRVSFACDDRLN